MKKTGILPLFFLLGFICLSMSGLADAAEKESTIEVSGLIYSEKPTEPGTGSTADSATDSGKSTGGDTSGTSGSSDTKGNLPQTNAVGTSRWVAAAGVLLLLGSLSLLSKKTLSGDTNV
ncbi:LPXTG cell wall anchor domain-containing protein [Enterococcus faecium]|uniref:LPXTG cell wall anchor domain-containing protein n=1 Tax=Enterococcus faecium TaxID=1352 RepID=UPI0021B0797A|nr:LPXTG cell wall anchor domain-containing protein [Enterococcus faecium]MCS8591920.1 LPXTG cell wall anchor domain-containing protein [Enterococcus faecium]